MAIIDVHTNPNATSLGRGYRNVPYTPNVGQLVLRIVTKLNETNETLERLRFFGERIIFDLVAFKRRNSGGGFLGQLNSRFSSAGLSEVEFNGHYINSRDVQSMMGDYARELLDVWTPVFQVSVNRGTVLRWVTRHR